MLHATKSSEPIPGYVVEERIGVGGYGEVWRARAPGGLTKAIKFVYGYFDDARAARELKALDRIKQVRHPFLLSLERFEIVDGQLIVVTELADMSLKDRFEQARESGLEGIPRDELLGYMRDAADALDYMNENFSLQHLDVKPENLLLVGGRVKVADFGLVKNVHEVTASMMGGLTPIYAAPEVFDDRPSKYSDQYSLAIVYQEMLTGHLPFPGRTPAQLASQHLHASPRLATLPAADQLVIAQALAKIPVARLTNCRSMIDALLGGGQARRTGGGPSERSPSPKVPATSDTTSDKASAGKTDTDAGRVPGVNVKTQVRGDESASEHSAASCTASLDAPAFEPIVTLDPIDVAASALELRPTLFLGVGGTAGRALRRLRRRLDDRFGPAGAVPAMQMLLVDTDVKSLFAETGGDRAAVLGNSDTMPLPMRSAHDYTESPRNMTQWLSRRWLYNIPRSLQTEGRRPLGRLALVDHAPKLIERLRTVLAAMTRPEAIAASAEATGVAFRSDEPRVFVIASISGGTGGGMALDVAYAVRRILADLGFSGQGVCEILTHSTDRNPTAAELATANAYASLAELQHYGRFGYCPGDPACGLPPPADERVTLGNAYFVHLGDGLNDQEFEAATDALATYLYLNAATSAATLFDASRAQTPADTAATSLRSFSLTTIGSMHTSLAGRAAEHLCREIVDHWRGVAKDRQEAAQKSSAMDIAMQRSVTPVSSGSNELADLANRHAAGLGLSLDEVRQQVAGLVDRQLGGNAETVLSRLAAMIEGQSPPSRQAGTRMLLEAVRGLFDPTAVTEEVQRPPAVELRAELEQALKPIAAPKARAIAQWIGDFVNDPAARVAGALHAKQWYAGYLRQLEAQCASLLKDFQHNLQALEQTVRATEKAAPTRGRMFGRRRVEKKHVADVDELLRLLVEMWMEECALYGAGKLMRLVAAGVATAGDRLKDVQQELGQWSQEFEGSSPWEDADNASAREGIFDEVRAAVAGNLRDRMPQLIRNVDDRLQATVLAPQDGLSGVCERADAMRGSVLCTMRVLARAEVLGALKQITIDEAVLGTGSTAEDRGERLRLVLDAARAKLSDCGGFQRLFAVLPAASADSALQDALSKQLTPPATVIADTDADLVLCYEQQELSLVHVAARLIDGRSDIIQIAGRLHTRMDVPWSQLSQPGNRTLSEGVQR